MSLKSFRRSHMLQWPRVDFRLGLPLGNQGIEVPLPFDREGLSRFLAQIGWYVSVLTPPGQPPEVPILFAALCASCAQVAFPPEILKAAEEHRQQLIQGAR